jgi:hypothetical protein
MCRNIKTLFNRDPPVTSEEIRAASLQFVRKISGFNKPSKANEGALLAAVDEIAGISTRLSARARYERTAEESGRRGRESESSHGREIRRLSLPKRQRLSENSPGMTCVWVCRYEIGCKMEPDLLQGNQVI